MSFLTYSFTFTVIFFKLLYSQAIICKENITDCSLQCLSTSNNCIFHCDEPISLSSISPCSIGQLTTHSHQSITIHCSIGFCSDIQINASLSDSLNIIVNGGGPSTFTNINVICPINGECELACADGCGFHNNIDASQSSSLSIFVVGNSLFSDSSVLCPSTPHSNCQFTCDGNSCERLSIDGSGSSSLIVNAAEKAMMMGNILCPNGYSCTINCDQACTRTTIDAKKSSQLTINLPTLAQAISQVVVYCPSNKLMHGPADTCIINADSDIGTVMDDWKFYALEGFHDLLIRCIDNLPENCMTSTTPTVYCGPNYWLSCKINYVIGLKTYELSPSNSAQPSNWCNPESILPRIQIHPSDCGRFRLDSFNPTQSPSASPSLSPSMSPSTSPSNIPTQSPIKPQ